MCEEALHGSVTAPENNETVPVVNFSRRLPVELTALVFWGLASH